MDLSRSLPKAQLDGFDISDAHFPHKSELPENVKLFTHDALRLPPDEFVGKYDVVHIGRINLFIRNENPAPLLQNFIAMLSKSSKAIRKDENTNFKTEPGGYLPRSTGRSWMSGVCIPP